MRFEPAWIAGLLSLWEGVFSTGNGSFRIVVPDFRDLDMKKQSNEKSKLTAISRKTTETARKTKSRSKTTGNRKKQEEPALMPTIRDIAVMTGFSMATVSRVMSGRGSVLRETAELIRAAAHRLGYSPDRAAQALAQRSAMVRQSQARLRHAS
jgi:hypothetical protein